MKLKKLTKFRKLNMVSDKLPLWRFVQVAPKRMHSDVLIQEPNKLVVTPAMVFPGSIWRNEVLAMQELDIVKVYVSRGTNERCVSLKEYEEMHKLGDCRCGPICVTCDKLFPKSFGRLWPARYNPCC